MMAICRTCWLECIAVVRWFLSPSLGFLQFLVLSLCTVTLGLLWGLYFQHKVTSQQEALVAKAVEHLNLATIASENLSQLVDRAQAIGRVAQVDQRGQRQGHWSLVQMLADDPVIKRISLYGPNGQQRYSSHSSEPQQLPKPWVEQLNEHIGRYGLKPILPRLLSLTEESAQPDWRLPFLLPLADPMTGLLDGILLVQLDIGYLVGLFQHVDLGSTGLVRLLDDHGNERLRISGSGMVIGGGPLHPSVPDNNELAGRLSQFIGGDKYQSLYRRDEQRGFSVTVSQNEMARVGEGMRVRRIIWVPSAQVAAATSIMATPSGLPERLVISCHSSSTTPSAAAATPPQARLCSRWPNHQAPTSAENTGMV